MKKQVFLTLDVDYTDYFSGEGYDELETVFSELQHILAENTRVKTTWFIRIDDQLEKLYGAADYIFQKHHKAIEWLQANGHTIGWHHHAYKMTERGWEQELDTARICEALYRNGRLAATYNLKMFRAGWGFHTNQTMACLDEMGFKTDSSAIPRPVYSWEMSVKDWSVTPQQAYHPSQEDYRKPGEQPMNILEIPISTTVISSPADSQAGVMRYINPVYHHEIFREALTGYPHQKVVLIVHPYELIARKDQKHALMSFDIKVFKDNLNFITNEVGTFHTLEEYQALNN